MEKRSSSKRDSERVKVKEVQPKVASIPTTVRLVLLQNLNLNISGPVTKKQYVFNGAGAQASVNYKDVPGLLTKTTGKGCCGPGNHPYFRIIE